MVGNKWSIHNSSIGFHSLLKRHKKSLHQIIFWNGKVIFKQWKTLQRPKVQGRRRLWLWVGRTLVLVVRGSCFTSDQRKIHLSARTKSSVVTQKPLAVSVDTSIVAKHAVIAPKRAPTLQMLTKKELSQVHSEPASINQVKLETLKVKAKSRSHNSGVNHAFASVSASSPTMIGNQTKNSRILWIVSLLTSNQKLNRSRFFTVMILKCFTRK